MSKRGVVDILGPGKEDEILQSFVRVGIRADEESVEPKRSIFDSAPSSKSRQQISQSDSIEKQTRKKTAKIDSESLKKRKPKEYFDEFYTDKDRAAAVSAGSYDIKQSLKLKRQQDRHVALQIPEEADPSSLIALALKEMKDGNFNNAISTITRALEINASDVNALVSRSKCYLLLGEPSNALKDAETALTVDKSSIRAIYQKAESLYFLGQFEQSLVYFHRGLRLRPELASFRLGVQKTQEAIENTIGIAPKRKSMQRLKKPTRKSSVGDEEFVAEHELSQRSDNLKQFRPKTSKIDHEKRNARKLLGELCVDKEYLENLLKHPDLKRADTNTESISGYAREAVEFLNNRQEFWRQQRPCTALPNQKNIPEGSIPGWF